MPDEGKQSPKDGHCEHGVISLDGRRNFSNIIIR